MSSTHVSRGGGSSHNSHGVKGDSQTTASTGNEGLTKSEGLYRTFTPSNAGWSLQDFAWDKQAHRVASREDISAAQRERRERDSGSAMPVTDPGSAGRVLHAPRPVYPLASAKLAARGKGRGAEPAPSTRKTRTKDSKTSSATETDADKPCFSRRCAATSCDDMCQPSSRRRVERVLCVEHAKMRDILVERELHRFCQVCYALHPTSAFKSTNRTCNAVLARKRALRIQRQKKCRVIGEEGEDAAHAEEAPEVSPSPERRRRSDSRATKPAKPAKSAGAEGRGERARSSSEATATRPTSTILGADVAPALDLLDAGNAGATGETEAAETSGGAGTWLLSSLGLASGAAPAAKRAREIGPPVGVSEQTARNQMILDMEHGALGSAQITSAAIKIPYATPAYLSLAAAGTARVPPGVAGGSPDALGFPGHAVARAETHAPHAPRAPRGFSPSVDHEMNALVQWMDQAPVRAPARHGEPHPAEDFGTDPFIRPGSLIYGVHSQGVVTDSGVAVDDADDANEPVSARTRHSSRSMLRALASPENGGGRLLRNAAAALREKTLPDAAALGATGGERFAELPRETTLDASGDGLLRIPEGVFGSFNGEICRLDVDPKTGETTTAPVKNTPVGFPEGVLAGSASILDSAAHSATLTLPFVPAPGTQMVCMFQGAHLPLLVEPRADGATDVTVRFHPKGGYHAAAEWALNGGETSKTSGDSDDAWPVLEGTASLEMLITEGPMRGLPVGRVLPLLLSPDAAMRREVASAMWRLERDAAHREVELLGNPRKLSADGVLSSGGLPDSVALVSMLGAVLHAVGKNQEPNPRMHRGAVAMAHYFSLERLGARLGENVTRRGRTASTADVTAMMHASMRAALAPRLLMFLAALVAAVCVAVYAKSEARAVADNPDAWAGIGASVAAVALSAWLVSCLARVSGLPERKKHQT